MFEGIGMGCLLLKICCIEKSFLPAQYFAFVILVAFVLLIVDDTKEHIVYNMLYCKDFKLKQCDRIQTIYFFSKRYLKSGTPCDLSQDYI